MSPLGHRLERPTCGRKGRECRRGLEESAGTKRQQHPRPRTYAIGIYFQLDRVINAVQDGSM